MSKVTKERVSGKQASYNAVTYSAYGDVQERALAVPTGMPLRFGPERAGQLSRRLG
jgi:hypothetical protein